MKPGNYHSLLITTSSPFIKPFSFPLARVLGLGRKTAVRERPVWMISPLCVSSDFATACPNKTAVDLSGPVYG